MNVYNIFPVIKVRPFVRPPCHNNSISDSEKDKSKEQPNICSLYNFINYPQKTDFGREHSGELKIDIQLLGKRKEQLCDTPILHAKKVPLCA